MSGTPAGRIWLRAIGQSLAATLLDLPQVPEWAEPSWHLYVVRSAQRDRLQAALTAGRIGTLIHYPVPPYRQPAYAGLQLDPACFPVTEALCDEILSLPMGPHLGDSQAAESHTRPSQGRADALRLRGSCSGGAAIPTTPATGFCVRSWKGSAGASSSSGRGSARLGDMEAALRGMPSGPTWSGFPVSGSATCRRPRRYCRRRGMPLLADPLISAYDKQVFERGKFPAASRRGLRLKRWEAQLLGRADCVLADTEAHAAFFRDVLGVSGDRLLRGAGRRRGGALPAAAAAPPKAGRAAGGSFLRQLHPAAGAAGHRRGGPPLPGAAGSLDPGGRRAAAGGMPGARRGPAPGQVRGLGSLSRAARADRPGGHPAGDFRHHRQGRAGRPQQGLPGGGLRPAAGDPALARLSAGAAGAGGFRLQLGPARRSGGAGRRRGGAGRRARRPSRARRRSASQLRKVPVGGAHPETARRRPDESWFATRIPKETDNIPWPITWLPAAPASSARTSSTPCSSGAMPCASSTTSPPASARTSPTAPPASSSWRGTSASWRPAGPPAPASTSSSTRRRWGACRVPSPTP